ncbi:diguanylate cyclase [Sphingomonas sp. NCPPB 2930]
MREVEALHTAWEGLARTWEQARQAPDSLENWATFMPHCDQVWTIAQQYGMAEITAALSPVLEVLDTVDTPGTEKAEAIAGLLPHLLQAVGHTLDAPPRPRPHGQDLRSKGAPVVAVLGMCESEAHAVLLQMEHYGYQFQLFTDTRTGLAYAIQHHAAAVLLVIDGGFTPGVLQVIDEIVRRGMQWCAVAERGDYDLRLEAVRRGALYFFVTPLAIETLVEVLDPLAFPTPVAPYRVLVLDDSRTMLSAVRKAMRSHPIQLGILSKPEKVLDVLHHFVPDVLLLDVHLEGCTGMELAKMIRQHRAFESIPIIFMTGDTGKDAQRRAMEHGGDEFLTKPVEEEQLVSTVLQKAERYRGLRKRMVEDSLTGLYNHVATKSMLEQCLQSAARDGQPLTYAIVDIDHFKRVNDLYGHAAGDMVIRTLSRMLRQRLRVGDVVGRYGGEEFAAVIYGCPPAEAERMLDGIRESFGRLYHAYEEGIFSVTFSAGVAHFPAFSGMAALMGAADEALYRAKRAGRNRVLSAVAEDRRSAA